MPYFRKGDEIPTSGRGSKLSAKMRRFVEEYKIDGNATQSVLRAGYKSRNPGALAKELVAHPLVRAALDENEKKRSEIIDAHLELTQDFVLNKLRRIILDTEEGNPSAALRGLELLGKTMGMFKDRTEISGPDGAAIEMEQRVKEDLNEFSSKLSRLIERNGSDGPTVVPISGSTRKA